MKTKVSVELTKFEILKLQVMLENNIEMLERIEVSFERELQILKKLYAVVPDPNSKYN